LQNEPIKLYEENYDAIMMANVKRLTKRIRYVDTQQFALQEWMQKKEVVLEHARGTLHPSDALTRPLGWILHHQH
jgi:hypothetical protein